MFRLYIGGKEITLDAVAIGKIFLYTLEFIWALVIFAVTSSKVKTLGICEFGPESVCNFGIAWGVIGWILTIMIIFLVVLHALRDSGFTPFKECVANGIMAAWWFIAAVVFSAKESGHVGEPTNVVTAFSWMITIFAACSSALALYQSQKEKEEDLGLSAPPPPTYTEHTKI
eukprot:jgi/Galph1/1632/GphlegSOOS_G327.1